VILAAWDDSQDKRGLNPVGPGLYANKIRELTQKELDAMNGANGKVELYFEVICNKNGMSRLTG